MERIKFRHFLKNIVTTLLITDCIYADADPSILQITGEHIALPSFQVHPVLDHRPQLSSVQQQQILNDVQQHQSNFDLVDSQIINFPFKHPHSNSRTSGGTDDFTSLARYRVDRRKQQQQQQQQQQQTFLQTAQTQYQLPNGQNYLTTAPINAFNTLQTDVLGDAFQNFKHEKNFYNNQPSNMQLQTFYEKQRELELLRKQQEDLITEQHALRRQQELLEFQRIRESKSSSPKTIKSVITAAATPTTTTTTTTAAASTTPTAPITERTEQSTTQSNILLASPTARKITPAESEIFLKAIATHQKKFTTTTIKPIISLSGSTTDLVMPIKQNNEENRHTQGIPKNLLSLINIQNPPILENGNSKPQIKIIHQAEMPSTLRKTLGGKSKSFNKDQLLQQLKIVLAENIGDNKNITTRDLILPNGRKLQVVQASNGLSSIIPNEGSSQFQTVTQALDTTSSSSSSSTTTVSSAKTIFDELTKGVLPPGADFEILRHKADGRLEEIDKAPIQNHPGRKVTFVVLEEQPDGSYKVQGVKGNGSKDSSSDIDSIVDKIKNGELKLPRSNIKSIRTNETTTALYTTIEPTTIEYAKPSIITKLLVNESSADPSTFISVTPNSMPVSSENYITSASSPTATVYNSFSIHNPMNSTHTAPSIRIGLSTHQPLKNHFIPTMASIKEISSTATPPAFTTTFSPHAVSHSHISTGSGSHISISTTPRVYTTTIAALNNAASENLILDDFQGRMNGKNIDNSISQFMNGGDTMADRLRREGLFAMAKYLRQSGLDTVLNETGPYTIFVPTDKAFRALLVQLGGPEKAEQKFRENPRLLSGLLLHHVIPGAFRSDALQEEMTGVSLAGTQLRVNVYDMHDHEWNDVKVTTINGAKILSSKRDIEVPQGIAHAVDRVLFPLPIGDLIQTLAADREQRFITFLKILHTAGMVETLAGTKTFTVFAPTDAAFAAAAALNGRPAWSENDSAETAKAIASKHIMPTTLYTAGMRYYHQKDTLWPKFMLKIQRNGGRIRVNEAQVSTNNVPATNGVIHAIDAVL